MTDHTRSSLAILGGPKAVTNPPVDKWVKINDDVKRAVLNLMDRGIHTIADGGGVIAEFEAAFAEMVGTPHALAMNSGTATLHSAYFAVGCGPGDEVIVPAYTWHATITPIIHCAATPVFCDIDPVTLTADPDDIERKITPRTKAICVVHVWGNVCDMDRIADVARRHGLALIEDASHAHGATWQGRPVGSIGDIGCFSLQGVKAVSGGEAGVAVTRDAGLLERMLLLGHFGRKRPGGPESPLACIGDLSLGAKYRPHPWAIAMALVELRRLPELNRLCTRNYTLLNEALRGTAGMEVVDPLPGSARGGYLEFKFKLSPDILEVASREAIVDAMEAEGVPVRPDRYSNLNFTYGLLHTAPLFTTFDRRTLGGCFYDPTRPRDEEPTAQPALPHSEDIARRLISLPACADVSTDSLDQIAAGMRKVLENVERIPKGEPT